MKITLVLLTIYCVSFTLSDLPLVTDTPTDIRWHGDLKSAESTTDGKPRLSQEDNINQLHNQKQLAEDRTYVINPSKPTKPIIYNIRPTFPPPLPPLPSLLQQFFGPKPLKFNIKVLPNIPSTDLKPPSPQADIGQWPTDEEDPKAEEARALVIQEGYTPIADSPYLHFLNPGLSAAENEDKYRYSTEQATPKTVKRKPKYNVKVVSDSEEHGGESVEHSEVKLDFPTKPVYPGEGKWAKPGKHRPYQKPAEDLKVHASAESSEDKSHEREGYDILKSGKLVFNKQKKKATKHFNKDKEKKHKYESDEESDDEEFVPTRLYTQVRKHEDEEHLPVDHDEPRLRKIVTDSRVHTVYTEEGYEDTGYDHAGHEKNAENNENFEENHGEKADDSEAEGTIIGVPVVQKQKYAQVQQNKTTKFQNMDDGRIKIETRNKMKMLISSPELGSKMAGFITEYPRQTTIVKSPNDSLKFAQLKEGIDNDTAHSIMQDIGQHFRTKRDVSDFKNDFLAINVSEEYVKPVLKQTVRVKEITTVKYPYYDNSKINKHSPLKYAEDMKNIPDKKFGELSFYKSADNVKCQEVTNINPIPKRAEDPNHTGDDSKVEQKSGRLVGLGDKIDCFKAKYFGEEPLDSPLFNEELVEQPAPLFQEFVRSRTSKALTSRQGIFNDISVENISKTNELSADSTVGSESLDNGGLDLTSKDVDSNETAEPLPESAALRMRRRKLKIHILRPIPGVKTIKVIHKRPPVIPVMGFRPSQPIPHYEAVPLNAFDPMRRPNAYSEVQYKDEIRPNEQLNVLEDVINNIKDSTRLESVVSEVRRLPETRKKSKPSQRLKVKAIRTNGVDQINSPVLKKLLTTTTTPRSKFVPSKTRFRKRPVAENALGGHYGDKDFTQYDETFKTYKDIFSDPEDDVIGKYYEPTTTSAPVYRVLKKRRKQKVTTPNPFDPLDAVDVPEMQDRESSKSEGKKRKKSDLYTYTTLDVPINKYIVPGMRPPSVMEKPVVYSEFKIPVTANAYQDIKRRSKRSPGRMTYSEIKREPMKRPQENITDETDDDYVPHRPTNYHYDVKSDKIIYNKSKQTTTEALDDVEYDYVDAEVTEKPKPVKTTTHKTVYHKDVLNPANGLTLVDFLAKLRSDSSYVNIPDPEPTEAPTSTTTIKSDKTTIPPEFLAFLQKLHSSKEYVKIEDPDETKKKTTTTTTTTTQAPEVEVIEDADADEDKPFKEVQNAPGGQFSANGGFQIFDINEYLPKTKNYAPRTQIDYSKYTSIERISTNKNKNSDSEADDDDDEEAEEIGDNRRKYSNARPNLTMLDLPAKRIPDLTKEMASTEDKEDNKQPEPVAEIETTTLSTTTKATVTTTKARIRFRNRTRGTTVKPVTTPSSTTSRPTTTTVEATTEEDKFTHKPPTRVYSRRQRPKIRLRPSTTEHSDEVEETTTTKIITKRNHLDYVPHNHKAVYTPIIHMKPADLSLNPVDASKAKLVKPSLSTKHTRMVTQDILDYNQTREANPRKLEVETIHSYDENLRHGGNYISEADAKKQITVKANQTDLLNPVLPSNVNTLKAANATVEEEAAKPDYDQEQAEYDYDYGSSKEEIKESKKDIGPDFDDVLTRVVKASPTWQNKGATFERYTDKREEVTVKTLDDYDLNPESDDDLIDNKRRERSKIDASKEDDKSKDEEEPVVTNRGTSGERLVKYHVKDDSSTYEKHEDSESSSESDEDYGDDEVRLVFKAHPDDSVKEKEEVTPSPVVSSDLPKAEKMVQSRPRKALKEQKAKPNKTEVEPPMGFKYDVSQDSLNPEEINFKLEDVTTTETVREQPVNFEEYEELHNEQIVDRAADYDYDDEVKMYFKKEKATIVKDPSRRLYFYAI